MGNGVSTLIYNVNSNNAVANINECLGRGGGGVGIVNIRPLSDPFLARNGGNTRGVRNVNTKFVPRGLSARVYSRVVAITSGSTVGFTGRVYLLRNLSIKVSTNTTLYNTLRVTGERANGVIIVLPSNTSECVSARLFRWFMVHGSWLGWVIVREEGSRRSV